MRDWRAYVDERLHAVTIKHRAEVVAELAAHLEECYSALRAQGLPDEEACAWTCARAGDWDELRLGIIAAKETRTMSDRVKQIWIPSLLTLVVGWAVLGMAIWSGSPPLIWESWHEARRGVARGDFLGVASFAHLYPPMVIVYWPWLISLPVIGAVGAYLSRRAKATGWRVYVSGAFPLLAIAVVFAVTLPFASMVDPQVVPFFKSSSIVANLVSWLVLPGIALWIGIALQGMFGAREGRAYSI